MVKAVAIGTAHGILVEKHFFSSPNAADFTSNHCSTFPCSLVCCDGSMFSPWSKVTVQKALIEMVR